MIQIKNMYMYIDQINNVNDQRMTANKLLCI